MIKNILAVIAGIAGAMATFMLFEQISHSIYPFPAETNMNDKVAMTAYMEKFPLAGLLLVLAGWIIGSINCGFLISVISKSGNRNLPLIAGGFLTLSAIINMYTIPHPVWFMIIGVLVFVPSVLFGFRFRPIGKKDY
jgi:sugar phosphate permease